MQPILFQNDIARLSETVTVAQIGNENLEVVAETKCLDFNLNKSLFIVIGAHKSK